IVGKRNCPPRNVQGKPSPLQNKAGCAARAVAEPRHTLLDVDANGDAGDACPMSGLLNLDYLGMEPNVIDNTNVGGSGYKYLAAHARRDTAAGKSRVALLTYGSTTNSNAARIGVGGRGGLGVLPGDNMEAFVDQNLVANYAMVARRHMHQYGSTNEQLAEISV